MTKIINLFGGPGSGKSTIAAMLFSIIKMHHKKCELVTEYAKHLVWEDRTNVLEDDQFYIAAKQNRRIFILQDKVDYVIVDSPLILVNMYTKPSEIIPIEDLKAFVLKTFNNYQNINIFLERNYSLPYETEGRTQKSISEAEVIDHRILKMLDAYEIPYTALKSGPNTAEQIFKFII